MTDFDRYGDSYEETVQASISFAGQDHGFFLDVKAELLVETFRRAGIEGPVLEVGCGAGTIASRLVSSGLRVCGCDPAGELLAAARERYGLAVVRGEAGRLPFADGSVAAAVAVNVFHHVPPPEREAAAREMARVIRPGGLAAILEHNPWNPLTRKAVRDCPFDEDAVLLSRNEAAALPRGAGLRIVARPFILFFPWRGKPFRRIEGMLGWLPLGAQYAVIARKETA